MQHELGHYIDFRKRGLEAYSAQTRGQKEQFVFDMFENNRKRWGGLTEAQRTHASDYVDYVEGLR